MALLMGFPGTKRNSTFRLETPKKRLDLTSYMSYNDAEGRRPGWPTAFSIISAYIARYVQPFLSRSWPKGGDNRKSNASSNVHHSNTYTIATYVGCTRGVPYPMGTLSNVSRID